MAIINESYVPPFALLVLDGDDNRWKVYSSRESDEGFDKDEFLTSANRKEYPNGVYVHNYIDAKIVPNENLDSYLEEAVDVGTDSHTETINVELKMEGTSDSASFDYHVSIDDVGQIVITPDETSVSFVDVKKASASPSYVSEENSKIFAIGLTTNMISEDDNFEYFFSIDDVGQAVITPESEKTSFLTVSVDGSLNLVTECNESIVVEDIDPNSKNFESWKKETLKRIDSAEKNLRTAIYDLATVQQDFRHAGIQWNDLGSELIDKIREFVDEKSKEFTIYKLRERIDEYQKNGTVEESVEDLKENDIIMENDIVMEGNDIVMEGNDIVMEGNDIVMEDTDLQDKQEIVNRFMQGDISLFSGDGEPEEDYIHLDELDSVNGKTSYTYYYDKESDAIVCYSDRAPR